MTQPPLTVTVSSAPAPPISGPGAGRNRRRLTRPSPGRSSPPVSATTSAPACAPTRSGSKAASTPSTSPPANCAPMYDTAAEPGGVLLTVRQPPRNRLPRLLGRLQARRPPARPRRADRRQRRPRDNSRASVRVRHPDRSLVRPGPLPPDARQNRAALPPPPRRERARRCPHGRDISCPRRHGEDDPRLGRPLCADCYDYDRRRPVQRLRGGSVAPVHHLPASLLGPPAGASPRGSSAPWSRIRYVKVAEYQARGVVHFHAIIRLDAPGERLAATPPGFTADMLCRRHPPGRRRRRHHQTRPGPSRDRPAADLRFGTQGTDARPVRPATAARHRPRAVGPGRGQLHRQVRHQGPRRSRHPRPAYPLRARPRRPALLSPLPADDRYRVAARRRQARLPAATRLCKWAHMLGYGGHFLTKSRRYSTTFGLLRRARTEHRSQSTPPRWRT